MTAEAVIVADELPLLPTESPAAVLRRIGGHVKKELRSAVGKRVLRAKMRRLVAGLRAAPPAGVDYDQAFLARMLGDAFEVAGREVVRAGRRALCDVLPR